MRSASLAATAVSRTPSGEQQTTRLRMTIVAGATASGCARTSATRKRLRAFKALLLCQLPGVGFVSGHQLHNLTFVCAGSEQLSLHGADAAAYFKNSGAVQFFGRDTLHHPAFDRPEAFPSILLEILARDLRLEHLLTRPGTTAIRHNAHDTPLREVP